MTIKFKLFISSLAIICSMFSTNIFAAVATPNTYIKQSTFGNKNIQLNSNNKIDITPQDYEKELSNQTLVDNNKKIIFVNNIDDKNNAKNFLNILDYLISIKKTSSDFSTSKYTLTKSEIETLNSQLKLCQYRNSNSCIKTVTTNAQDISKSKEDWNQLIILISQVVIAINVIILLILLLNSNFVLVKDNYEN